MLLGHQDVLTESPKLQTKTFLGVNNINYDLSHKHYAPERPVLPGLLKYVTEIVLKLKNELWAETMLLWVLFRPERYP